MGQINASKEELQVAFVFRFNPKLSKALIYHKPLVVKAYGFLFLYSLSSTTGGRNEKEKKHEVKSPFPPGTKWVFIKRGNKHIQLPGKTTYGKEGHGMAPRADTRCSSLEPEEHTAEAHATPGPCRGGKRHPISPPAEELQAGSPGPVLPSQRHSHSQRPGVRTSSS